METSSNYHQSEAICSALSEGLFARKRRLKSLWEMIAILLIDLTFNGTSWRMFSFHANAIYFLETERVSERDKFQTLINHNKLLKRVLKLGNLKAISRDNVVHLNFSIPLMLLKGTQFWNKINSYACTTTVCYKLETNSSCCVFKSIAVNSA